MLVLVPMVLLTLHRSHTLSRYSALTRSFAIVSSRASTSRLQPRDSQYKHQALFSRAANDPSVFTITEKAPNRAFSCLKAPTSAFTFKTILRHFAKWALIPQ